jgi:hypothetical protein
MDKNEKKDFISPATTPIIIWILKSVGRSILGWITWTILERIRGKKSDVDKEKK